MKFLLSSTLLLFSFFYGFGKCGCVRRVEQYHNGSYTEHSVYGGTNTIFAWPGDSLVFKCNVTCYCHSELTFMADGDTLFDGFTGCTPGYFFPVLTAGIQYSYYHNFDYAPNWGSFEIVWYGATTTPDQYLNNYHAPYYSNGCIRLSQEEPVTNFQLYDSMGGLVINRFNKIGEVDVTSISKGIYIYSLETEKGLRFRGRLILY